MTGRRAGRQSRSPGCAAGPTHVRRVAQPHVRLQPAGRIFAAQAVAAGDMHYVMPPAGEHDTGADVPRHHPRAKARTAEVLNPEPFRQHELIHQGESAERIADRPVARARGRLREGEPSPRCRRAAGAGEQGDRADRRGDAEGRCSSPATKACAASSTSRRWPAPAGLPAGGRGDRCQLFRRSPTASGW